MATKRQIISRQIAKYLKRKRRLEASMPAVLDNLEHAGHKAFDPRFKNEMLMLSHGTMDRMLKHDRKIL